MSSEDHGHAHHARRWLVEPGTRVDLGDHDPRSDAGAPGPKAITAAESPGLVAKLGALQERLWAEQARSLLVVLQAMDAGGKDGTIRHVFTGVNPQGVRVSSFKAPTAEELAHDYLWRIHRQAPARGEIGVFNRSHYEDVLIVRVNQLVDEGRWRDRYRSIRAWESMLAEEGTTIVKLFLHISADEQAERFRARLDDPTKRWKFSAADLEVREHWHEYQRAYEDAISETSAEHAPWYVIPADRKWYRNWAVLNVLLATLEDVDPQFPPEQPGLDDLVIR